MNLRSIWRYIHALLFENRNARQTVFKNAIWMGASSLAGRMIRAGLVIYVARVLGTAGYGVYSYALGISGFFAVFSDIGINGILTREGSRNKSSLPAYIATSTVIKVALVCISASVLLIVAPIMTKIPQALPLIPLAAVLLISDSLRDFTSSITRAQEKMEIEAGISIFTNLAITGLGIAILFVRPSAGMLMTSYTLGSIIGTVGAYWILRRYFVHPIRHFRLDLLKPILVEAFPFAFMGLLSGLMLNSDTVMLGWMTDAKALGLYSAAQRPIQILYIVPGMLSGAVFPVMARLAIEQGDRFRRVLEQVMVSSFVLAIPIVVGGIALGHSIVLLLFGEQYQGAAVSFLILLTTILLNFPGGLLGNGIFAHNQQKNFLIYMAIGALGNIVFNFLLIPRWGIEGSSVATVISQVLSTGFMWWKMKKIRYFEVIPKLKKIVLASLLMGAVVFGLHVAGSPVLVNIAVGVGVYFAFLLILREPVLTHLSPVDLIRQPAPSAPTDTNEPIG